MASFISNGKAYDSKAIVNLINTKLITGTIAGGDLVVLMDELEWLKDVENPLECADKIAATIRTYGPIIFESEYYYCQHKVATIMDILADAAEYGIDEVVAWLLLRAFKKAGFKYAVECSMNELRQQYARMGYTPYALSTKFNSVKYQGYVYDTYEYDQIKEDRAAMNQEIIEECYHPRRIDKWISEGNDLEDYLM